MSTDFLSMSDADFMAKGPAALQEAQAASAAAEPTPEQVQADADAQAAANALAEEHGNTAADADDRTQEEIDAEAEAEAARVAAEEAGTPAHEAEPNAEDDGELGEDGLPLKKEQEKPAKADKPDASTPGLPEGAERIFETFRANGRDMQVKSVDEAIRLMQMGVNYSQKQAENKKNRAFVKVLEQNGLLDHEKLSFAVDLINGKPEAIGKLLKDTKVDVHDLDDDKVSAYRAQSRAPSETVLNIEAEVDSLSGTEHFDRLVEDMQKWDTQSQALLGSHPGSMGQLIDQMKSGVYDKVMNEVHRQQVLGGLVGKPIMQAYNEIGQKMAEAGAFNAPAPKGDVRKLVTGGKKASPATKADEERRRAAAPVKGVSTNAETTKQPEFLAMSDEEFLKTMKR